MGRPDIFLVPKLQGLADHRRQEPPTDVSVPVQLDQKRSFTHRALAAGAHHAAVAGQIARA